MTQISDKQGDSNITLLPSDNKKINLHDSYAIRCELGRVYRDMRSGKVEAQDGTRLGYMLNLLLKAYETSVLETDLREIKSTLQIGKNLRKENDKK